MKSKMKHTYPSPRRLALTLPTFFVYIDGYNLYMGINHDDPPDLLRLGWSNYQKLGERLVDLSFQHLSNERTVTVKYFTAIVAQGQGAAGEIARQTLWLDALKQEAPEVEVVKGLHVVRPDKLVAHSESDASDAKGGREEKMTDVNIAVHAIKDIIDLKPAGLVLVSGDQDFRPVVEFAAKAHIPVAVFFPQDHYIYQFPLGVDYLDRVETTYLTQEIMKDCRLKDDKRWLEYLHLKVQKVRQSQKESKFQKCLDYEMAQLSKVPKSTIRR